MSIMLLQLKKFLAPAGVLALSIWGLYLGVDATIVRGETAEPTSAQRSIERSESIRADRAGSTHGVISKNSSSGVSATPAAVEPEPHVSARVQVYQSARRNIAIQQVKEKTASKQYPVRKTVASRAKTQDFLRSQILAEARQMAVRSDDPWLNLITVSSEYYRNGDKESARDLLKVAERLAVYPDDASRTSAAVGEVVKAMLAQRNNADAVNALQNINKSSAREKAIGNVAAWAAREGRLQVARTLMAGITTGIVKDIALVAIAESEASYEGVNKALRTAELIVTSTRRNDAYRRIALKRGALRDFSEAERAVVYIKDVKIKDSTLGSLAKQRARSGDLNGGLNTLLAMNDPIYADASLRSLSDELANLGKFTTSAYVTTRISGDREKSFALEKLSVEQARSGDLMGSLLRADAIPNFAVRERTLRSVSSVTADRGAPKRARNVAISINSNKERDRAFREIAVVAAKNGDHTSAFNTLQEIDQPKEKALALVAMARSRQTHGNGRKALALLEGAGRAAQRLTSQGEIDSIRATMAVAYAERSDSGKSLLLVKKIKNPALRDNAFKNLARALVVNHDVRSAQASVSAISSKPIRRSASDHIARSLAQTVAPEHALRYVRSLASGRQRIVFLLAIVRKI